MLFFFFFLYVFDLADVSSLHTCTALTLCLMKKQKRFASRLRKHDERVGVIYGAGKNKKKTTREWLPRRFINCIRAREYLQSLQKNEFLRRFLVCRSDDPCDS